MAIDIKNFFQNSVSGVGHTINTVISSRQTFFKNMIGETVANLSSLWDGGFVGINDSNRAAVYDAVKELVTNVGNVVNEFNSDQTLEGALQGPARVAAKDYIDAVKELLNAYVSSYNNFGNILQNAFSDTDSAHQDIASSTEDEVTRLRNEANNMKVEWTAE